MGLRGVLVSGLIALTAVCVWFLAGPFSVNLPKMTYPISEKASASWWKMQLQDPETGEIPRNIRNSDLDFVSENFPQGSRSGELEWKNIGPFNIGGRTRALAIDRSNTNRIIAGAASGGIFLSENEGKSWKKVSTHEHNLSITWITQDPRVGKENRWYASTGEARGASQGASNFSAHFGGDGVLVSNDFGKTWNRLGSFINDSPQRQDSLDLSWKILVDNQSSSTILMLATPSGIFRSENQGATWLNVHGRGNANQVIDIVQTKSGVWYATISAGIGSSSGLFRSTDGLSFNLVKSPAANLGRGIIGLNNQNENSMFVLFESPNSGLKSEFLGRTGFHSLFKYTYISGNGSGLGGNWKNLSLNLPKGIWPFDDYYSQTGYCMDIKVSPYDSNTVALAGVNLNISHNGFSTAGDDKFAGGYYHKLDTPFYQIYPNHHPDVHTVIFHPTNPKIILTGSDGGVHLSRDLYASQVVWESLNNGYVTTQFYTLALDKKVGSQKMIGGLQDNGTLYYLEDSLNSWSMPVDYDGAYCHFLKNSPYFLAGKQQAGLFKVAVDGSGKRIGFARLDPVAASNYLFINPYMIDPNDNNLLFLPNGNALWRNSDISAFPLDNKFKKQTKNWEQLNISGISGAISAVEVSTQPANVLYFGTSGGAVVRVDSSNADYSHKVVTIPNSNGFVSSIAVHPKDADKVVVVFSNYNVYSVFYSETGGETWQNISGNIEGTIQPGIPAQFAQINNGPSCRVAKFVELRDATWLLLGTSVGLFGILTIDSNNTVWSRVSESEIGTHIVTAIDYRLADGYLGVATHGGGVFSSYVTQSDNVIADISEKEGKKVTLYPNPSESIISLNLASIVKFDIEKIQVYNGNGSNVNVHWRKSGNTISGNIVHLPKGTYIIRLPIDAKPYIGRFIKI